MSNSRKTLSFAPKSKDITDFILDKIYDVNPVVSNLLNMQRLTGLRFSDCRSLRVRQFIDRFGFVSEFTHVQQKLYNSAITRMLNHPVKSEWPPEKIEREAKNKSLLRIYVTETMQKIVEDTLEQQKWNPYFTKDHLFASSHARSNGEPITRQYVNRMLKSESLTKALAPLGLTNRNLGTHSFRKDFGQRLLENGATVVDIKDLLGQHSLESTIRYLSSDDEKKRSLIEKL
ncbi:tyrosine-type recombinase/integrase [Vibrio mediterranei]|uniref:Tyrosine-type recombinase/integrase n=1 Tax=Vibrio qingdaonensis TaxID=2829491 RepID=A0A9X3CSQ0_9VIBR|nr:tyrosine-type recombinase/integrase [Vibrio qingdaonensis]MCW8349052.1 tyrosine-type recombinase/integrase [Vibrio qingdaonensis]